MHYILTTHAIEYRLVKKITEYLTVRPIFEITDQPIKQEMRKCVFILDLCGHEFMLLAQNCSH